MVGVRTGTRSKIIFQDKTTKVTEGEENEHMPSTKGMDENAKWTPGGHSMTMEVPGGKTGNRQLNCLEISRFTCSHSIHEVSL